MTSRSSRLREKAEVLDASALDRALTRIAHEILERNGGAKDVTFVGLRTRGVTLAQRLAAKIAAIDGTTLPVGALDITLYRDDLNLRGAPVVRATDIPRLWANSTPVMARVVLPTPAGPVITAPRWATRAPVNWASSLLRPTSGHPSTRSPPHRDAPGGRAGRRSGPGAQ